MKHARSQLAQEVPVVLAGDFNVMPTELDVCKPESWKDDALFRPEVRGAFKKLTGQGWIDAVRTLHPDEPIYTFWDCFRNHWQRNAGLRIDHFLLSPQVTGRLLAADVDREVRGWEHSSDHAPVWIELGSQPQGGKVKVAKKAAAKPAGKAPAPPLEKYREKRDFTKTSEPVAKVPRRHGNSFVIYEHHARTRPGAPVSMPVSWEQLPEITDAGFTIHEPPQTTDDWMNLKPQTISSKLLKDLGVS